ncbi:hypothetical protein V8G69_02695 [Gaetbulibacter sp. M235]|uniref:hypothetical protein n=1 Tax=Gaetbulibacter sp. M235 TaxID=3126510 RepID=UPI00374F8F75
MEVIVPVFQFEIRFNHILDFSQISRSLLAPFVKLAQSLKVDKQNTLEEIYSLNFEDDNYIIIVSWDRIVFKGQGSLETYTKKNSPIDTLFFGILDKIMSLSHFGGIQRSLFFATCISKVKGGDFHFDTFSKNTLAFNPNDILENSNDIAIVIESKTKKNETSITFGPYLGPKDLLKRTIGPVNISALDDLEFEGIMFEYKNFKLLSEIKFVDFVKNCTEFNDKFKKIWNIQ